MFYLSFIVPYSVVAGIYSERGCHVTYVNLRTDWFIKIARTANQSVAMVIIRLQQISLRSLSLRIALSRVSLFSFIFQRMSDFTIISTLGGYDTR